MKKLTLSIVCLLALSFAAVPVGAQTRSRSTNTRTSYDRRYDRSGQRYDSRVYRNNSYRYETSSDPRYQNDGYYDDNGYYEDDRSVWERSRDKITTAIGAGAGATIGGLIGGKRGAIIGAIAGGGGAALYTYKIRDKDERY
jgi:hypothetical protein